MDTKDTTPQFIKPRVLVVDDSRLLRKAANKILKGEFDVVTAEDGEDGWEKIAVDDTVQVVFCDLMMPILDGYELLERIRSSSEPRISELPVIIVTGGDAEEAKEKALGLGATDFITKPFNSIDVLARAKAHSKNQQKTQELTHNNALLAQATTIDASTGLGNKLYFVEKIKQDLSFSRRHRLPLSLIVFEFTEYNNIFLKNGKKVSEKIMQQISKHISSALRIEDGVARVSASQIVVTLLSTTGGNADMLCHRILESVRKVNFLIGGQRLDISLRYGSYIPTSEDALTADETLLRLIESLGKKTPERKSSVSKGSVVSGKDEISDLIKSPEIKNVVDQDAALVGSEYLVDEKQFGLVLDDITVLYQSSNAVKKTAIMEMLRKIQ